MREKILKFLAVVLLLLVVHTVHAMDMQDEEASEARQAWDPAADIQGSGDEAQLDDLRKQEAVEKLKEILGIRGNIKDDEDCIEVPPQYMMELYNTVTDSEGNTRENNPYNAKVVRSFIEKDSSSSHFYIFNISSLEPNESVLEAELHLFRKRSSPKSMHPSVLSSPHYLIRVYQVLQDKSLEEPDLHRLLNVHYVGAYASGWQVFNIKQAVLSWFSGTPNLGLLVTATTIFGDQVTVDFSRRNEEPHDKQPILVLFNDDGTNPKVQPPNPPEAPEEEEYEMDDNMGLDAEETMLVKEMQQNERIRSKRHESVKKGQLEEVPDFVQENRSVYFRRDKKGRRNKQRDENDIGRPRKTHGFVSRHRSLEYTLTSMDIYQRAMLREKLNSRKGSTKTAGKRSVPTRVRRDAATVVPTSDCRKIETEPCAKRELYVNFRDIGLSTIIAPEGYSAYQCRGHCKSPLSQDQKPTNHATIQGIIHKMKLAPSEDVDMPCCVPVTLSSISILYLDDNDKDGVVLKSYTDMSVVSCGCR